MDTREKIITPERAAALAGELRVKRPPLKVVTGYFDVLMAEHVERLCEIANGAAALFVVVANPPAPVLDLRARAELVAALAVVDYVVPAERPVAVQLLRHFQANEIIEEESADLLRAQRLIEHVQRRHQQ